MMRRLLTTVLGSACGHLSDRGMAVGSSRADRRAHRRVDSVARVQAMAVRSRRYAVAGDDVDRVCRAGDSAVSAQAGRAVAAGAMNIGSARSSSSCLGKFVGVGVTAFIFDVTRTKLLQMGWFKKIYQFILMLRARAAALVEPVKQPDPRDAARRRRRLVSPHAEADPALSQARARSAVGFANARFTRRKSGSSPLPIGRGEASAPQG